MVIYECELLQLVQFNTSAIISTPISTQFLKKKNGLIPVITVTTPSPAVLPFPQLTTSPCRPPSPTSHPTSHPYTSPYSPLPPPPLTLTPPPAALPPSPLTLTPPPAALPPPLLTLTPPPAALPPPPLTLTPPPAALPPPPLDPKANYFGIVPESTDKKVEETDSEKHKPPSDSEQHLVVY